MSAQGKIYRVSFETFDDFLVEYGDRLRERMLAMPSSLDLDPGTPVRIKLELPDGEALYLRGRVASPKEALGRVQSDQDLVTLEGLSDEQRGKLQTCLQTALSQSNDDAAEEEPDKQLQILLVDDFVSIRIELGDALRARGARVRIAENGLVAVAAALKRPPDVILSDVEMPVMDGWTFLRMVRSRKKLAHIPFVFFTHLSDDMSRLQGYRMGVDDYLAKATTPDEILARVRAVVKRNQRGASSKTETVDNLRGDLRHVRLGSLLSFLEGERRTGTLFIEKDGQRVGVVLVRGAIFDIDKLGRFGHVSDRVFEMLNWETGEFEFIASYEVYTEEVETTAITHLLLEHARRADEAEKP